MGELIVSADLLKRGFEVFRSLSPNASCDLVAQFQGRLFRVEVTKGNEHPTTKTVSFSGHDPEEFDLLALYFSTGQVEYRPPLNVLTDTL